MRAFLLARTAWPQLDCRRLAWVHRARAAYDKAIELAGNTAETACLTRRRGQLG